MSIAQLLSGTKQGEPQGVIHNPRIYEFLANTQFLGARRHIWAQLAATSGAAPGDRVLDIGCGTGYFAAHLAPLVLPGGSVAGIDPSPSMTAYADAHSPEHCSFTVAGAEQLPFADSVFDLAVSSLAFHHIPHMLWPQSMVEIFRVLRPGGVLFLVDFRPPHAPLPVRRLLALTGAEHVLDDPRDRLRKLVIQTGFVITGAGEHLRMHHIAATKPTPLTADTSSGGPCQPD